MNWLNQNMPKTYADRGADDLASDGPRYGRARPRYRVADSPGSTQSVESEYAFAGWVMRDAGDMVLFRFEWASVPGEGEQFFYPYEIHAATCLCRACVGDFSALL